MKAKKILLMGHADGLGGSQTAFRELYKFVRDEGHNVRVIALSDCTGEIPIFQRKELLGCIAHRKSKLPLRIKKILDIFQVGINAWRFKPDIFICVGLNNSANAITRFIGKYCFKIGQDFIADRNQDDLMWHSSRSVMNGLAVQAPSMLNQWQRFNTTGINWLPCFPEPPIEGVLRVNNRTPLDSKVRLVYFGRLANNKGLALLLCALADPKIPSKVTLDLWGKGEEEIPLRKLTVELGLEAQVRFLGSYPNLEKGAILMSSYDALILCSTACEGLPLVLLESMAYGLPFLTTDIGAISDCCLGNADALLVQPTHESITNGLETLVKRIESQDFDPIRLKHFYDKTFSHKVMAARWRECIQNPKLFFYES